jgi:predicted GNAT family acetyltransferase
MNQLKTDLILLQKDTSSTFLASEGTIDFEVKFTSPAECKKIATENHWQNDFRVDIDEILKESSLCATAMVDGALAHWTQITFGAATVEEIKRKINPGSQSAYLHGVYTARAFRKKGITGHVLSKIAEYLHGLGISRIYIFVDAKNRTMLGVVKKAGFEKLGKATHVVIGGLHIFRVDAEIRDFLTPS